jgi:hypothetical protein
MSAGIRLQKKLAPLAHDLAAIGSVYRLTILWLLSAHDMNLSEVCDGLRIKKTLALHHLTILVQSGWIRKFKLGRVTFYQIEKEEFTVRFGQTESIHLPRRPQNKHGSGYDPV